MRSELWELTWPARIARPDAIYDAPAATENFANFKPGNCDGDVSFGEDEKKNAYPDNPKPSGFESIPGFKNFAGGGG